MDNTQAQGMGSEQIAWVGGNVQGHSRDSRGKIDSTEGFGAFDSIFKTPYYFTKRAIDIGGGEHDHNCTYLDHKYLVDCAVYDPFKRGEKYNRKTLKEAKQRPVDTVFSLSVLNVISTEGARREHVLLCSKVLKPGGKAVFKVWPGDCSGEGKATDSGYQSNCNLESYMDEISQVFGRVHLDADEDVIMARNPRDTYPSGSTCIF